MDDHPTQHAANDDTASAPHFTAQERALIAQGEASLARSDYVSWTEIRAWMLSLGTEAELPEPPQRKR